MNQEKKRAARRSPLDRMLFQPNFLQAKKRKESLGSLYDILFRTANPV